MLAKSMFYPTLPASDLERAKRFYGDTLGFRLIEGTGDSGGVFYRVGDQVLFVYKTATPRGGNTALSFVVDDLDAEMTELRAKGVTFEEYDMPGLKTQNGVVEFDGMRGAWFKDSEDNILSIQQPSAEQARVMREALK